MKRHLLILTLLVAGAQWLLGQAEVAPQVLNMSEIIDKIGYPMEAKSAHVSGKVVAKVKVDEKGKVVSHEIAESPSPVLAEAVDKHVGGLKFRPAQKAGQPVAAWVMLPFTFSLPESTSFSDLNDALASLGEVESLDLSNKQLKAIDSRLPQLTSLRKLNLSGNEISLVQPTLSKLRLLEELNLSGNPVTSLPKKLKKLKNLKRLDISGTKISGEELEKVRTIFDGAEIITE